LLPLSIVALIYLNSRAVKERFQLDEDPDELREKRLRNLFGSWYYVMRGVRR